MGKNLILAHDLGTSSDKAVLFDDKFNFLAESVYGYDTYYPQEGYCEHDPKQWWEAVKASTKEVVAKAGADPADVKAMSFSAHGMATIPFDKDWNCLVDRIMIWSDARPVAEAAEIVEKIGARRRYEMTGNSFDVALYPAAKMLWYKRHMPEVFEKTYKFAGTKEYLIHKMTGEIPEYTDYTECHLSGLYNLNTKKWDPELMAASEVTEDKLLKPCESTKVVGHVSKKAAEEMGLCEGVAIVQGSWDNYACATGGGVYQDGHMVCYLGTAGWMGIQSEKPLIGENVMSNVAYAGHDRYFTITTSNSACAAYEWVMNNMCADVRKKEGGLKEAEELAATIKPGSDKLFFLPSMLAGNTFYADSALDGSFVGLKLLHTEAHVIRAALEGVGFDLKMGSEFFKGLDALPEKSTIIGGGANSKLWCQILASMFGIPVQRPNNMQHIGALGAALFAGVGSGIIASFEEAAEVVKPKDEIAPVKEWSEVYDDLLPCFRKFYEQLLPAYRELQKK